MNLQTIQALIELSLFRLETSMVKYPSYITKQRLEFFCAKPPLSVFTISISINKVFLL